MVKHIVGICGLLAASLAQAQGTTHTINYPGGDGTPYQVSGIVDTLDYFSNLPNPAAGGTCSTATSNGQYYDQVLITNTGANAANVVFTLDDPNSGTPGVCNFASGTGDRPRMTYYNVVFSSSAPQNGCIQIVEFAGSPSTTCPQLSFSIPPGANNKATILISTARLFVPRPNGNVITGGGGGLFGYHGGMGGSSPVTLQSFSVGQGE
jgi:hypothetical protein